MLTSKLWSGISSGVRSALTRWQHNEKRRRLVKHSRTDANLLTTQRSSETSAMVAQIREACPHCPDWKRCKQRLEAGKGYFEFCPNVARFAELGGHRRMGS